MNKIIGIIFGCMIVIISLGALVYFNPGRAENDCPIPTQETTPTDKVAPTSTKTIISTIEIIPTKECTPTPEGTLTPAPKLFPTPTIPKLFPTPTDIPEGTATVVIPSFTVDPSDPQKRKTKTPTSTVVLVYQTPISECNNNCLCLLVTQAVIANDLQRTQIAIDLEQNSCSIP